MRRVVRAAARIAWSLALASLVAAAGAGLARAQAADTLGTISPRAASAADSTAGNTPSRTRVVGGTASSPRDSTRKRPWTEQPRIVMARSLLIPGWGQVHNRSWVKAVLVAGAESWLGVRIVQDQRALDDMLREIDEVRADTTQATLSVRRAREAELVNRYNARLNQRLGRQWLLGGAIAYAMVDAYVDAHFRGFDLEFQHDPALPPGTSPASPADRGGRFGLRVALRRDF